MGEFIRLTAATLLGALISFGTTLFFERRKDRRAEQAERLEGDRQLQQAARLALEELTQASLAIDRAVEYKYWWSNPPYDLERLIWIEYRSALARLLDRRAWWDVSDAYSVIAEFNIRLAMGRDGKEVSSPFVDEKLEPIDDNLVTGNWRADISKVNSYVNVATKELNRLLRAKEEPDVKSSAKAH